MARGRPDPARIGRPSLPVGGAPLVDAHSLTPMGAFQHPSRASRTPSGLAALTTLGLMVLWGAWHLPSAFAAMYECVDERGSRSFTDSPLDARQCATAGTSGVGASPPSHDRPGMENRPIAPPKTEGQTPETKPETTPPAGGYVSVPLQMVGRSVTLSVKLNGERQARLILDTGATLTLLSRAIARDLGLYGESPVSSALVNTAGGQVSVDVMRIGMIEAGAASARNVPVAIYDLPDAPPAVEGLLGLSFLSHFLVTLDMEHGELRLTAR